MIKISERLGTIGSVLANHSTSPIKTMADIGTDHGFLPAHLIETGVCEKAILTDVSHKSLMKGYENISQFFPDKFSMFDFRVGDGLVPINIGEAQAIVIAGMGGILISEILGEDMVKTRSTPLFVLQPRTATGKLRLWLETMGFNEVDYCLVREGKFICEILAVRPGTSLEPLDLIDLNRRIRDFETSLEDYMAYELPVNKQAYSTPLGKEFLKKRLKVENETLRKIKEGGASGEEKLALRTLMIEGRISHIKGILGE